MINVINFLKILLILLCIPKYGNYQTYYDCAYTIFRYYEYYQTLLPEKIKKIFESFFDSLEICLCDILKKYIKIIDNNIYNLEIDKEISIVERNSKKEKEIKEAILESESLKDYINNLLNLNYPSPDKVLIILYNDLDSSLSNYIMSNISKEFLPDFKQKINKLIKRYTVFYVFLMVKGYFMKLFNYIHKQEVRKTKSS